MTGIPTRASLMGVLRPFVFVLLLLFGAVQCMGDGKCVHQGEDGSGFLRIERLPDAHVVPTPNQSVTVPTKNGMRELIRLSNGDCETVFYELLRASGNAKTPRLVVETKDQSHYSVLLDHRFPPTTQTVTAVAKKLGLEIVHERRRKLAFVIRANDEKRTGLRRFQGKPNWPEATVRRKHNAIGLPELTYGNLVPREIKKFPNGGILFIRHKFDDDNSIADDHNLYFDGVSVAELAQYFEEKEGFPVVSQIKDGFRYSFTLPDDIQKRFSFGKTVPLPGLGVSVTSAETEMEVILVRDRSVPTD